MVRPFRSWTEQIKGSALFSRGSVSAILICHDLDFFLALFQSFPISPSFVGDMSLNGLVVLTPLCLLVRRSVAR